jgi:hypothetical protein
MAPERGAVHATQRQKRIIDPPQALARMEEGDVTSSLSRGPEVLIVDHTALEATNDLV